LESTANPDSRIPSRHSVRAHAGVRMAGVRLESTPVFYVVRGVPWLERRRFVTPLFLISHACALVVARRLAGSKPWLLRERSTLAFLAGAVLAPAVPALLNSMVLPFIGVPLRAGVPNAVDGWLRGTAGILAIAPAVLVYLSKPLKEWTGLCAEGEWEPTIATSGPSQRIR
jgi:hypothetical protein